jgi:hypothetical protein
LTAEALVGRARELISEPPPNPAQGHTAERHRRLFEVGREDLSLARLVEAHWDAVAILAEAGRSPQPDALYGVWAAESAGSSLHLEKDSISGKKPFCSGAGLVDRALLTVTSPNALLLDVELLHAPTGTVIFDTSSWKTSAFAATATAQATFDRLPIAPHDIIGPPGFYLDRPGFWHGACGPAACWAGGAAGLLDWALEQTRDDPHTLAHLGAMHSAVWSMSACLDSAGREIDTAPNDALSAQIRALALRHAIERGCAEVLRHLGRAYGPYPLAMNELTVRRYQELELYIRQSHGERDQESLGRALRRQPLSTI